MSSVAGVVGGSVDSFRFVRESSNGSPVIQLLAAKVAQAVFQKHPLQLGMQSVENPLELFLVRHNRSAFRSVIKQGIAPGQLARSLVDDLSPFIADFMGMENEAITDAVMSSCQKNKRFIHIRRPEQQHRLQFKAKHVSIDEKKIIFQQVRQAVEEVLSCVKERIRSLTDGSHSFFSFAQSSTSSNSSLNSSGLRPVKLPHLDSDRRPPGGDRESLMFKDDPYQPSVSTEPVYSEFESSEEAVLRELKFQEGFVSPPLRISPDQNSSDQSMSRTPSAPLLSPPPLPPRIHFNLGDQAGNGKKGLLQESLDTIYEQPVPQEVVYMTVSPVPAVGGQSPLYEAIDSPPDSPESVVSGPFENIDSLPASPGSFIFEYDSGSEPSPGSFEFGTDNDELGQRPCGAVVNMGQSS